MKEEEEKKKQAIVRTHFWHWYSNDARRKEMTKMERNKKRRVRQRGWERRKKGERVQRKIQSDERTWWKDLRESKWLDVLREERNPELLCVIVSPGHIGNFGMKVCVCPCVCMCVSDHHILVTASRTRWQFTKRDGNHKVVSELFFAAVICNSFESHRQMMSSCPITL